MRHPYLLATLVSLSGAVLASGQVTLNPNPSRILGHPRVQLSSGNPNLVEGRELYSPQGVAVDTGATPPILYVSDTGNNRVMAWKNAAQFSSGAPADFVIGQKDPYSTFAQGPGVSSFSAGLSSPTGLAVRNGDLYVVDTGNNRILRFPKPAAQSDQFPNMVIGQPGFSSRQANQGGLPSEKTLAFTSGSNTYRASVAFDAAGNLWVTDAANHRVLRYPAQAIQQGTNGPKADLILGQVDFTTTVTQSLPSNETGQQVKDRLQIPAGLAFDSTGRLYVSDALRRVLVFAPPFASGMPARRAMGVVLTPKQGQPPVTQSMIDRIVMLDPEGIFMAPGNCPAVIDTLSSRILIFDPYEQWPDESVTYSPAPRAVVGQMSDFSSRQPNHSQPEPSESTLAGPAAAVMAGSELYVADAGNHRIVVLPYQGTTFGQAVRLAGQDQFAFNSANLIEGREFDFTIQTSRGALADAGIAVDQRSDPPHLYVADTYNNRVLGFRDVRKVRPGDRADIVIGQPDMSRALCNYPSNDPDSPTRSGLCRPIGLAVDNDGNLWVADSGNGRVLRFPSPFAHQEMLPQADLYLGQTGFTSKIIDPTARTMASPYGLAFAGENGVLVSDQAHNRVLFFARTGGSFTSGAPAAKVFGQPDFTSSGSSSQGTPEDNRMASPHHIAADTDARIYVADTGNNRVLIFDQVGNTPATNARAVVSLTGISSARGIYVSPQTGELWVTDTNGSRCLRYPRFDEMAFNGYKSNGSVSAPTATLAVAQDQYGDLLLADASNRIAIHYPGLTALNGAHFLPNRALAPGMVASLYPFGNQFGTETKVFTELPNPLPLPAELADIQVLVDDVAAPLYFVSPGQINMFVPNGAPVSGTAEFQVLRKSTGQILASGPVQMNVAAPALFTATSNGTGQVMALNQDGSVNSPTNPAARGTVITLFGTGQGLVAGAPRDGDIPQGLVSTSDLPRVIIGSCFVDECGESGQQVTFSGLAPGLVGVWQINVRIPTATLPDNKTKVALYYKNIPSTGGDPQKINTTIAVKQ